MGYSNNYKEPEEWIEPADPANGWISWNEVVTTNPCSEIPQEKGLYQQMKDSSNIKRVPKFDKAFIMDVISKMGKTPGISAKPTQDGNGVEFTSVFDGRDRKTEFEEDVKEMSKYYTQLVIKEKKKMAINREKIAKKTAMAFIAAVAEQLEDEYQYYSEEEGKDMMHESYQALYDMMLNEARSISEMIEEEEEEVNNTIYVNGDMGEYTFTSPATITETDYANTYYNYGTQP